jgi:hypothetical protein
VSSIEFDSAGVGFYRDRMTWIEVPLPNGREARDFLGAMNEIDHEPGSFSKALVTAALLADIGNRRKLRREFGGLISAVILYKEHADGFRMLYEIAGLPVPDNLKE